MRSRGSSPAPGGGARRLVPGVIALLAIYVRATCPESPYWVRTQDRKRRIAATLAAGRTLSTDDRTGYTKADKVGIRQVFMPDVLPATLVATFITCCSCCIYGTVGAWMPLYLSTEKHWSTAQYSTFYIFWASSAFSGYARPAGSPTRSAGASALSRCCSGVPSS